MDLRPQNCPSDFQLDCYLLEADREELAWIGGHLETCPICQFQAQRRRAQFTAYALAVRQSEQLNQEKSFEFKPWTNTNLPDAVATRLAAQGQDEQSQLTSLTMVTADQQIMMKILRDPKTQETWLYLLSEKAELCQHALVFPFGWDEGFVTDSEGRANLGRINWPSEDRFTAELRLPAATFSLVPLTRVKQGTPQTITSPSGDSLKVTYYTQGKYRRLEIEIVELRGLSEGSPLRVAVCEPESTHLHFINARQSRVISVGGLQDLGIVDLYIYQ